MNEAVALIIGILLGWLSFLIPDVVRYLKRRINKH